MADPKISEFSELTGIYRSFETNEDVYANDVSGKLSKQGSPIEPDYIKDVVKILFPPSAGSFISAQNFWRKLKELGTSSSGDETKSAEKKLARLVRVYYCGPNKNSTLESEISDWYKNSASRSSAYKYPFQNSDAKNKKDKKKKIYKEATSIREMANSDFKSELMMVLVDAPALDLKKRNANKVEFFINYMPPVMMSQAVPYLDVKFITTKSAQILDTGKGKEGFINFLSPLKFLSSTGDYSVNTANSLIYQGYSRVLDKVPGDQSLVSQPSSTGDGQKYKDVLQQTTTGIEMFTMPQTLVNMNYDQERNPRYNPVINPVVPFGVIESATINAIPSYSIYSFKTAGLSLKIFDRTRLNEIADILNPELYSSTSVVLTYGWRAPVQNGDNFSFQNKYHNFINENLLVSEVYGIRNSSISLEGSNVVNLTLDLFTKGAAELRDVNPNGASISFKNRQSNLITKFEQIRSLAKKLNLTTITQTIPDVRGSVLIGAALGGGYPELDVAEVEQQITILEKTLNGRDPKRINQDVNALISSLREVYATVPKGKKAEFKRKIEEQEIAKNIIQQRFESIRTDKQDLFTYIPGEDKQNGDAPEVKIDKHPLLDLRKNIQLNDKIYDNYNNYPSDKNNPSAIGYGSFGEVSFGRVFFTYFSSAYASLTNNDSSPVVEEYQVFFYNLNNNAGPVANLNIAEFPIDMKKLEDEYARQIIEQKGENMSLAKFLEIVRDSQFSDVRHPAFGFADLYELKDGNMVLKDVVAKDKKGQPITGDSEFLSRTLKANPGTGEAFVQPVVDFYIECGYETSNIQSPDLLNLYENASNDRIYGQRGGLKKIIKIHIYDKAATPHELAASILSSNIEGGYIKKTGKYKQSIPTSNPQPDTKKNVDTNQSQTPVNQDIASASAAKDSKTLKSSLGSINTSLKNAGSDVRYEFLTFKDANGNPRIELVKGEIARLVPTIIIGNETSMISKVSFSTNQDSALSTIMMLRNRQSNKNPMQPNGAGIGDLPMRVIPGALSMTIVGCPIIDYMQQFFVDLNTGTSIDNLYNIINVSHSIGFGKYTTDIKFGFYDAYGKYSSDLNIISENEAFLQTISDATTSRDQISQLGKDKKIT